MPRRLTLAQTLELVQGPPRVRNIDGPEHTTVEPDQFSFHSEGDRRKAWRRHRDSLIVRFGECWAAEYYDREKVA